MIRKMKLYRRLIITACLLALIIIISIYITRAKDYTIDYVVDETSITEKYNKKLKYYLFNFDFDDVKFEMAINSKYLSNKKLILGVEKYEKDDTICIYPKSKVLKTYPLCKTNEEYISFDLIDGISEFYSSNSVEDEDDSVNYKSVKVSNLDDLNILIWSHYGYYYINSKKQEEIRLFSNDIYGDTYSFQVDKYVIIPNLDEQYSFNSFVVINLENGKKSTIELDEPINYDYYFLGSHKKNGYIVDKKDKKEYVINPYKKKVEVVSKNGVGMIWNDGFVEESVTRLAKNTYAFYEDSGCNYHVLDDKLYLTMFEGANNILISERKIDKIVVQKGLDVFFISKNKLYRYNTYIGEKEILDYSELEFNKNISIYIY